MTARQGVERPAHRALVVDDDHLMVDLVSAFLKKSRGYEVETADDGVVALARVAAGGFNLVITDCIMPHMDGLSLARAIRALPGVDYVYCIMMTSLGQERSLVAAMEAGVDDFVSKPLRLEEFGARLQAAERVIALEAGLASRNRELAKAYGQLSRELDFARAMQLGQLPAPGVFGRVNFEWVFEASSFVGGDIFDYFALDDRHLCFYVADVSGHGVAAAMLAFHAQHQLLAASQQALPAALRQGRDLGVAAAAVVSEYNRRFLQMKETHQYLTLLYGVVDMLGDRCALVQAGHPAPFYSASPQAPFLPLGDGGLPIGVLADAEFEAITVPFAPGARLVLYSDGITDCRNAGDEAFGEARLRDLLAAQDGAALAGAGPVLHEALRAWRGRPGFEDDVTFLALEVR